MCATGTWYGTTVLVVPARGTESEMSLRNWEMGTRQRGGVGTVQYKHKAYSDRALFQTVVTGFLFHRFSMYSYMNTLHSALIKVVADRNWYRGPVAGLFVAGRVKKI
jgi:hypothetical protein